MMIGKAAVKPACSAAAACSWHIHISALAGAAGIPPHTYAYCLFLACRLFEDVMRKKVGSPNALMESMHLKRFADEGSRQAMTAAELAAAEASTQQARKAAMREAELGKLAAARADKSLRLQRDEAVHATLLKHQVG